MSDTAVSWPDFLLARGATRTPERSDAVSFAIDFPIDFPVGFAADAVGASGGAGFLCALTHLGVIAASGDDVVHFLHNQLTNDVEHLDESDARLVGYCSPKGRLLATMLMWRAGDRILLALPRELLPATLKRLQMFVLRAKVKLVDASDEIVLMGGAGTQPLAGTPWQRQDRDGGAWWRVPDAGAWQRWLWAGPVAQAMPFWQQQAAQLAPASAALWRWSEIIAGLPQVLEATKEQFVPQMINFELVGGVNFRKGCYPGQEIVARSQYLGQLKRRALLAYADDAQAQAGVEVFADADPDQPCGMVVNAERGPDCRLACLVELKMALADGVVRLGSASGTPLQFAALPYDLADPTCPPPPC